jgi:hypothetical protein
MFSDKEIIMKEDLVTRCLWILNFTSKSLPSMKYFPLPVTWGSPIEGEGVSIECLDGRKLIFAFETPMCFRP